MLIVKYTGKMNQFKVKNVGTAGTLYMAEL
jgi:hypothetical protein